MHGRKLTANSKAYLDGCSTDWITWKTRYVSKVAAKRLHSLIDTFWLFIFFHSFSLKYYGWKIIILLRGRVGATDFKEERFLFVKFITKVLNVLQMPSVQHYVTHLIYMKCNNIYLRDFGISIFLCYPETT
jgi:hypothetical protein